MKRKGAAAVEMAIVVPVITIMVLGMLEYGSVLNLKQRLIHAAREGARYGMRQNTTEADVERVVCETFYGDIDIPADKTALIDIETVNVGGAPGDAVVVKVKCQSKDFAWFPPSNPMEVGSECTMRKETASIGLVAN